MATLLLRLSAPMQSWGTQSNFEHRDTGREPSKSGVIGLLCAALGRPREESVDDLASLRMGVRIDQPGQITLDYHTAGMGGIYKVDGGIKHDLMISRRFYLADARFLVGLEGTNVTFLHQLHQALQQPRWFLFLGRKSCMPAETVWLDQGVQEENLETSLRTYPSLTTSPVDKCQFVIEDPSGQVVRNDQPISFSDRLFLPRRVRVEYLSIGGLEET